MEHDYLLWRSAAGCLTALGSLACGLVITVAVLLALPGWWGLATAFAVGLVAGYLPFLVDRRFRRRPPAASR
jgi:hypothetical protein